jgi:hypothetical protein
MQRLTYSFTVVAVVLATSVPRLAFAGGCEHCGGNAACQKVCRLVCEEKKVEITCWGCKCEDFCVPGPSKPGCKHCETVCEFCEEGSDPKSPVTASKKFVWTEWIPGCAKVYTKKTLMKRTVTKTIPSYKWVVEDLCGNCEASLPPLDIEPAADVPPPPSVANARVIHGLRE